MVQQKGSVAWAGMGRTPGPRPSSRALGSHWLEMELCPLTATVSGSVSRSVAKEEGPASGWPGWLPHPAAFSVSGSIESSQLPAGSQGI